MRHFLRIILVLAGLFYGLTETRAQVCCDTSSVITLCYLSAADYCASNAANCFGYSIDGNTMANGLVSKLLSPLNFGPNGKVNCPIQLQKLGDVSSVQAINDQGCDMIFMPNSFVIPDFLQINLDTTFIPEAVFAQVYAWSQECPENLVIATQGEAGYWGYKVQNANVNPNTPSPDPAPIDIFNGPFGSLTQFFQGGTYQGVFVTTPPTGMIVLARDNLGQPTVVLDIATNDIMLGDIGIFCSGGAGPVTTGPGINNSNDILACNIFALACAIATLPPPTQRQFAICPLESVALADGTLVSAPGVYVDTLVSSNGCDSLVITEVLAREIPPTYLSYTGCQGDGYSVKVRQTLYNEANPQGTENMVTDFECDSLIIIDLVFQPLGQGELALALCPGDSYLLSNGVRLTASGTYTDTLTAFNGCDSILSINLVYLDLATGSDTVMRCRGDSYVLQTGEVAVSSGRYLDVLTGSNGCDSLLTLDIFFIADTTYLQNTLCPGETLLVSGQTYGVGDTYPRLLQNQAGCDSLLLITLDEALPPAADISRQVISEGAGTVPFRNTIPPGLDISWIPPDGLGCLACPNPPLDPRTGSTLYTLRLVDGLGCIWDYAVAVEYRCPFYLPTAFSPNDDGINDQFGLLGLECRVEAFDLRVYDRWGGLVFEGRDVGDTWDGTSRGKRLDPGVYVWVLEMESYGQRSQHRGEIQLLR